MVASNRCAEAVYFPQQRATWGGNRFRNWASSEEDVMKTTPNPGWAQPAKAWTEIVDRYAAYLAVPTWRAKAWTDDGKPTADHVPAAEAAALRTRLLSVVVPLVGRGDLTDAPEGAEEDAIRQLDKLQQAAKRRTDMPKEVVREVWRALLLNRDGYTCQYCRRTAWGVLAESNQERTLRFELDHKLPKPPAAAADEFAAGNLVAACRSCIAVKGQMDESRFRREIESLAVAVLHKTRSSV